MKSASFAAILVGLVLLAFSTIASSIFNGRSMWTEELANRRTSNQQRIFGLQAQLIARKSGGSAALQSHASPEDVPAAAGKDSAALQADLDALKAQQQTLNDQFNAAHNRPSKFGGALRWSGIILAALGILGWYAANQQN
jgi:hypothetical protein